MTYSDLQRSLVRLLLDFVRAKARKPMTWLSEEINFSEAVLVVYAAQQHRVGKSPVTHSSVDAFMRGKQKPNAETMEIYVAFLVELGLLNVNEFSDLDPQILGKNRALSQPARIRRGVFPHSASYAETVEKDRFKDFRYLHLDATNTVRHVSVLRVAHYARQLNESDQRLKQRCERGASDSRLSFKGYLYPLEKNYRLEVVLASDEVHQLIEADVSVTAQRTYVDKVDIVFESAIADGTLSRITPISGERDVPILTKSLRNNMMVTQDRFIFPDTSPQNANKIGGTCPRIKEFMFENREQDRRLLVAARNGDPREMALALVNGANINARELETGATPLHLIALHGLPSLYEVLVFSPEAHAEILMDLEAAGLVDLGHADEMLRTSQSELDPAVLDNNALFPSEYCQQGSVVETRSNPILQAHKEIYRRLTFIEWDALEAKGMNRGMNKGFDYEERAAAFGLVLAAPSPNGPT